MRPTRVLDDDYDESLLVAHWSGHAAEGAMDYTKQILKRRI